MHRKLLFATALIAIASTAQAADKLQWPTGALNENDTRVVAFYNAQCAEWADGNGIAGGNRDGYIAKCIKEMPELYPVGYEKPDGEEE